MYKFGDIASYESKTKKRKKPFIVVSDVNGSVYGLILSKKIRSFKNKNRFFKIPTTIIGCNLYNYIDMKNGFTERNIAVIDEQKSLKEKTLLKLRKAIEELKKEGEIREEVLENLEQTDINAKSRTRLEPLSTEYHMPTYEDLYPNGTGRTKEEFEADTKYIHKKYLLEYKRLNNKQQ